MMLFWKPNLAKVFTKLFLIFQRLEIGNPHMLVWLFYNTLNYYSCDLLIFSGNIWKKILTLLFMEVKIIFNSILVLI